MWWREWESVAAGVWRAVGGRWDGFLVADGTVAASRWLAVADLVV